MQSFHTNSMLQSTSTVVNNILVVFWTKRFNQVLVIAVSSNKCVLTYGGFCYKVFA